jgi:putative DNA primase/helicase
MPDVVVDGQVAHKNIAFPWWNAGVSVVPIQANGTKRPTRDWSVLQRTRLTKHEIDHYWREGQDVGVAVICGAISGNLEMTELEAAATTAEALKKVERECEARGIIDLWESLLYHGYAELTPTGGLHFLYRITEHEIPGNTKLAQEPDPDNPRVMKTLAETRGEGGYVIVAPSGGRCHPTGDDWSTVAGQQGVIPEITWSQRVSLHNAITAALDATPAPSDPAPAPTQPSMTVSQRQAMGLGMRPGDEFNEKASWEDSWFVDEGWRISHRFGHETFWVRPGKDPKDGHSATTGFRHGNDCLYVFSTSAGLPTETPLSKFMVYALYHHGGDLSAAAKSLRQQGYGDPIATTTTALVPWTADDGDEAEVALPAHTGFDLTDVGSGRRVKQQYGNDFRFNTRENAWYRWDTTTWVKDEHNYIQRAAIACAEFTRTQAEQALLEAQACGDPEQIKTASKNHAKASTLLNKGKIDAAISMFATEPGIAITSDQFDQEIQLLNLPNGVLDLENNVFTPEHDPKLLMTKTMGASYDKDAQCPMFEKFMEDAFPDTELRLYVQRALGYSLLGKADERVMFLLHGPSGTGKSVLTSVMSHVFGAYGATAPASTFRIKKHTDTLDLHRLRGARFVATSEMPEGQLLDEDLVKRVTGGDMVTSRGHYEHYSEWRPNCVVWIATNFLPRVNSDDNAFWQRAKTIRMETEFIARDDHRLGYARTLEKEADGILNWLIEGMEQYRLYGLAEPDSVRRDIEAYRVDVDVVACFVRDRIEDGALIPQTGAQIKSSILRGMFEAYCTENHQQALGVRRYQNRLKAMGYEATKIGGTAYWIGLTQDLEFGVLGLLQ